MIVSNGFRDIEREIERRLILGLRHMFKHISDPQFNYDTDDKKTDVIITVGFPKLDVIGKVPQIVVSDISYSLDTQDSMYNNFFGSVPHSELTEAENRVNERYLRIHYSANIRTYGVYDTSRNLANKVIYYMGIMGHEFFSSLLKLNVKTFSKTATGPYNNVEKIFQTNINFNGELQLGYEIKSLTTMKDNISGLFPELDETLIDDLGVQVDK